MKIRNTFNKKRVAWGITAVILMIVSFALAKNTLAMPSLNVGLISFTATPQDNAALLEWETATELGTAGFIIQRKLASEAPEDYADVSGFINSTGDVAAGATYSYLDQTAVNGQSYTYQLVEYEAGGATNNIGEVQVTISTQATATPVTIGGGSNTTPTATPIPTSTSASATATTTTSANSTATATATTTSPTIVPTSRVTAVSTSASSSSTSEPTSTATRSSSSNPTATTASSNNSSVVFAQGETPAPDAYPAEGATIAPPQTDDTDYPANDSPIENETATPYPVTIEETTAIDDGNTDGNGTNVIGSGTTNDTTNTDNTDESDNSSTFYLWAGFLVALLIFITGLIGTAVLFIRRK